MKPIMSRCEIDSMAQNPRGMAAWISAAIAVCVLGLWASPAWANQDGTALRTALYAAATDGATVVFPWGTTGIYDIGEDSGALGYVFSLTEIDSTGTNPRRLRTNLTIDGNGVTLVVTKPTIGVFHILYCNGITIKNLTIDYNPLPWNQSIVTSKSVSAQTFDVQLDPAYLPFTDPAFGSPTYFLGALIDPTTRILKKGTVQNTMFIDGVTDHGAGAYTLHVNQAHPESIVYLNYFQPNDLYVHGIKASDISGGVTFNIASCEPTLANPFPFKLDGITCYAAAGHFISVGTSPYLTDVLQAQIINCKLTKPTPDGGRLRSGGGVGVFASGNRKGLYMNNCLIGYNMDDGVCFKVQGRLFEEYPIPGDYTTAKFSGGAPLHDGDSLQIFDPATGRVGTATISTVTPQDSFVEATVKFSQAVPGMYSDYTSTPPHPATNQYSAHAFNLSIANPGYEVRNSIFGRGRGNGAVLMCKGKFIGNIVDSPNTYGVAVSNMYTFFASGPVPFNVVVKDNTFNNCGNVDANSPAIAGSTILLMGQKWPGGLTPGDYQTVDSCVIEGNSISNWATHGIHVQSAKNALILNHLFSGSVDVADRAVYVGYSASNVTIDGVDTTSITGWNAFAVTLEHGLDLSVTTANIYVTSPTVTLEQL